MTTPDTTNPSTFVLAEPSYIGLLFSGDSTRHFFKITCPCGVVAEYPLNGMPTVDTPHPCGNPKHWTVKFEGGAAL